VKRFFNIPSLKGGGRRPPGDGGVPENGQWKSAVARRNRRGTKISGQKQLKISEAKYDDEIVPIYQRVARSFGACRGV
jgi:hypothetical protein